MGRNLCKVAAILLALSLLAGALCAVAGTYSEDIPSALAITLWLMGWCVLYAGISYLGLYRSANEI